MMNKNKLIKSIDYNEEFNPDIQKLFIQYLMSDPIAFSLCRNIISDEFFDARLSSTVKFLMEYAEAHRSVPSFQLVKAKTGISLEEVETDDNQRGYFLKEIETFCQYKALQNAIMQSAQLLEEGQGGEIQRLVQQAMEISLQTDLGTDYFADPKSRLKDMLENSSFISTGWHVLDDKLGGGFAPGTLNIFCGGPGCVVAGTKVRVISLFGKTILKKEKCELMNYSRDKLDYLLTLYSMEQIHRYCNFSNDKLDFLWNESQPKEVPIECLKDANDGVLYLVDSPDGYVPVEQWRNKGLKDVLRLKTRSNITIEASDDHLFQLVNGDWIFARDLRLDSTLLGSSGPETVISKESVGKKIVYDIAVGHENHRYYTDNISSHNSGKSLFLQNIALNWVLTGKNVIYLSLELDEKLISLRFDAMISNRGTKAVFKDIDETAFEIAAAGKRSGKLIVKRMREGTNTNDIRAFIKEYEIKTGTKPDCVVLDYLDLLHPNNRNIDVSNMFVKDKYTSEEFRGLLEEYQYLSATASQLNRSSVEANGEFTQAHIAGGISKINTADNAFGIYSNAMMKEAGRYEILVLKGRTSDAVGHTIEFGYNTKTMRITDPEETDVEKPTSRADLKKDMKPPAKKPALLEEEEPAKESEGVLSMMNRMLAKKNGAKEE
jgi:KaiC/GvpD/RAD55 family RecA-like ATPase